MDAINGDIRHAYIRDIYVNITCVRKVYNKNFYIGIASFDSIDIIKCFGVFLQLF